MLNKSSSRSFNRKKKENSSDNKNKNFLPEIRLRRMNSISQISSQSNENSPTMNKTI